MTSITRDSTVLVVGAGIMGSGIAQVAAQAGHPVLLYDAREGAAAQALEQLRGSLDALMAKGKLQPDAVQATLARIAPIGSLEQAAGVALAVEAIVENLAAKRELFARLEAIVADSCVLATNTSSISVTAIGNGLRLPGRVVGMHFFNPVPVMKLVEVVSGLQSDPAIAQAIFELAGHWGKVAVHAKSTPGFIVNRIARPYYAETLALLQERAAPPAVLDACLRGAGFRMGPCELMDLIGHDTNLAVTQSVYDANFQDKRFVPSLVQRELVEGGLLGRKSGRGFYDYAAGAIRPAAPVEEPGVRPPAQRVCVVGLGPVADRLAAALEKSGTAFSRRRGDWSGLELEQGQLRLTDGRPASELGAGVAVFDLPLGVEFGAVLAWAPSVASSPEWIVVAGRWLQALAFAPVRVADTPGLVVARTIAMLVNEAMDAVRQGVCTQEGADLAMKLGVNYPAGPFEWLATWDAGAVEAVLDALDHWYRGERYRVSPGLRQKVRQAQVRALAGEKIRPGASAPQPAR